MSIASWRSRCAVLAATLSFAAAAAASVPSGAPHRTLFDLVRPSFPLAPATPALGSFSLARRQERQLPGDFNGDGRDDVFLQGKGAEVDHLIVLAGSDGRLSQPGQSLSATWLALDWRYEAHALVAGDFDGDGKDDVLLQGRAGT